jgi:hypothetical protein
MVRVSHKANDVDNEVEVTKLGTKNNFHIRVGLREHVCLERNTRT